MDVIIRKMFQNNKNKKYPTGMKGDCYETFDIGIVCFGVGPTGL